MRYRFHHIENAPREKVEEYVRTKADLLETRLSTFEEDLVVLDVRLDYREKRYADRRNAANYDGKLVLYLPGQHLQNIGAVGHGEIWETAFNEAFDDLEDQLDKLFAKLNREPDIHDFQHRPSWEREGAELLGESQESPAAEPEEETAPWMEELEREQQG